MIVTNPQSGTRLKGLPDAIGDKAPMALYQVFPVGPSTLATRPGF